MMITNLGFLTRVLSYGFSHKVDQPEVMQRSQLGDQRQALRGRLSDGLLLNEMG